MGEKKQTNKQTNKQKKVYFAISGVNKVLKEPYLYPSLRGQAPASTEKTFSLAATMRDFSYKDRVNNVFSIQLWSFLIWMSCMEPFL